VTIANFRRAMRGYPTGVNVVTTALEGVPEGFTANSFASVSADPPTVVICVDRSARSHPIVSAAGRFCENVLGLEQVAVARLTSGVEDDPFARVEFRLGIVGCPILAGALAHVECAVEAESTAGSHTIFLGALRDAGAAERGAPLGYFDGDYRDFACALS